MTASCQVQGSKSRLLRLESDESYVIPRSSPDKLIKTARTNGGAAAESSLCPLAPVDSDSFKFLVAKVHGKRLGASAL